VLETRSGFLQSIRKFKARNYDLEFLEYQRVIDSGLIGTEKICPMFVEINSNQRMVTALGGIQFTKHLIEFVVVETKQIVSSNSNVILMQQTCGRRSGMAAASKHRALTFYFSIRICFMFLISKYTGESDDLGLCMISRLAKRMPLHSADFQ